MGKIIIREQLNNIKAKLLAPIPSSCVLVLLQLTVLLALIGLSIPGSIKHGAAAYVFGTRENHLTILGFLLPETFFHSLSAFTMAKLGFVSFSLLWALHLLLPLSSLLATTFFTLIGSIAAENSYYTKHEYHVITNILIILCAYYFWHGDTLRSRWRTWFFNAPSNNVSGPSIGPASTNENLSTSLSTRSLPAWPYYLVLVWFIVTYTYSGITKLVASNGSWADGSSLQILLALHRQYIYLGPIAVRANEWLASSYWCCLIGQWVILTVETSCALVLFSQRLRILYGTVLCGFHTSTNILFGLNFWPNACLTLWVFSVVPILRRKFGQQDRSRMSRIE